MAETAHTRAHRHHPQQSRAKLKWEACGTNDILRTRYFYSMLLEPDDLSVDQAFHLHGRRRHNAELHGFGTVCGLRVGDTKCAWEVLVEPGVALDCLGREIRVECTVTLDVRELAEAAFRRRVAEESEKIGHPPPGEQHPDPNDRECWPRRVKLWVVLCFTERVERPVQTIGGPETCCEPACENSRARHGFCVSVTDEEPEKPVDVIDEIESCHGSLRERVCEYVLSGCAACEPDPCAEDQHQHCLTLAEVEVSRSGDVRDIDNCSCRQLALPTTLIAELLMHHGEG